MATTVTSTIKPSGGDYTTLSLWEDDIPADLITDDEQHIAEGSGFTGLLEDTLTIADHGGDSTRDIIIRADDADFGWERLISNSGYAFTCFSDTPVTVEDCTIRHGYDGAASSTIQTSSATESLTLSRCKVSTPAGHTRNTGVYNATAIHLQNCLFTYLGTGLQNDPWTGVAGSIYNTTFGDCTTGASMGGGASDAFDARNNVAYDCTTSFSGSRYTNDSAENWDDTGDAYSAGIGPNETVVSGDFTNAATGDYSIPSDSQLVDQGEDLSSVFTDDITGATRGATFDVGAYEYISVSSIDDLLADDIGSSTESDNAVIGQNHSLSKNDVQSLSEIDNPSIAQSNVLLADNNQSLSEIDNPSIAQSNVLLADNNQSLSEIDNPVLGQVSNLIVDNAESSSELSSPDLSTSGENNLTADNVESASDLSNPVIIQKHGLLVNNIESTTETSSPQLNIIHNLFSISIESSSETSLPSLIELIDTDTLLAENIESLTEISEPTLGQIHNLLSSGIQANSELSYPIISELVDLFANDIEVTSEVSAPTLSEYLASEFVNRVRFDVMMSKTTRENVTMARTIRRDVEL